MQFCVIEKSYQLAKYKDKTYYLTIMELGMKSMLKVMAPIHKTIFGKVDKIKGTTNFYRVIFHLTKVLRATEVTVHLKSLGLIDQPIKLMADEECWGSGEERWDG